MSKRQRTNSRDYTSSPEWWHSTGLMNRDVQRTKTLPHQSTKCQKLYKEVTPMITHRLQNGGILHLVNE